MQVGYAMHLAVGIDNTFLRIITHTSGAHMMPSATGKFRPGMIIGIFQVIHQPDPPFSGLSHFLTVQQKESRTSALDAAGSKGAHELYDTPLPGVLRLARRRA